MAACFMRARRDTEDIASVRSLVGTMGPFLRRFEFGGSEGQVSLWKPVLEIVSLEKLNERVDYPIGTRAGDVSSDNRFPFSCLVLRPCIPLDEVGNRSHYEVPV